MAQQIDTTLKEQAIFNRVYDDDTKSLRTSSTPVTGYSTSEKQDSQIVLQTEMGSLIDTLHELVARLAPLAGAMNSTAQLRVIQTAVPSHAVTGPITSAQSIAEKNAGGVMYTMRVATENNAAVQSNINNCIGA